METAETITKTKWGIDASHSTIGFKVKHLMITNVKGTFTEFDASIFTQGNDFMTSEINFWLDPKSIHTGDEKRDAHLKGEDFFDVEHHKQITFEGNTFEKTENKDFYELYGNLSIKGISKQIKLDVEFSGVAKDSWGNQKAGFSVTGKINRKDWNLNWNNTLEAGGVLVSDEVIINCEVQLIKKQSNQN